LLKELILSPSGINPRRVRRLFSLFDIIVKSGAKRDRTANLPDVTSGRSTSSLRLAPLSAVLSYIPLLN